ncbi:hypothetical protein FOIG_16951 [Fusarium odoratissimum NRRL 54006]|uniref:Uncharacterized protein n=1 Tax=Fusarium odoratissimum (strain NRRL 54006) TaxID=1089451 RepID=X0J0J7_FUSO5|nr:uncharacterized protein FOIG_16951 [Fusarium odoratissimum NRRL 54006]EXL89765.1 hypothetical protein FOIG_16951 [Fusarium odoratissimum NRRL 54006]
MTSLWSTVSNLSSWLYSFFSLRQAGHLQCGSLLEKSLALLQDPGILGFPPEFTGYGQFSHLSIHHISSRLNGSDGLRSF